MVIIKDIQDLVDEAGKDFTRFVVNVPYEDNLKFVRSTGDTNAPHYGQDLRSDGWEQPVVSGFQEETLIDMIVNHNREVLECEKKPLIRLKSKFSGFWPTDCDASFDVYTTDETVQVFGAHDCGQFIDCKLFYGDKDLKSVEADPIATFDDSNCVNIAGYVASMRTEEMSPSGYMFAVSVMSSGLIVMKDSAEFDQFGDYVMFYSAHDIKFNPANPYAGCNDVNLGVSSIKLGKPEDVIPKNKIGVVGDSAGERLYTGTVSLFPFKE